MDQPPISFAPEQHEEAAADGEFEVTFGALCEWHKKIFEKFGWIYICIHKHPARGKEFTTKFQCYEHMVLCFLKAAHHKLEKSTTQDHTTKDLHIMKHHVVLLVKCMEPLYKQGGIQQSQELIDELQKIKQHMKHEGGARRKSRKGSKKGSKKSTGSKKSRRGSRKSKKSKY